MSSRLERTLQLLEAQQGQIGRLEQEVGSLRAALTFASANTETQGLPNGASALAGIGAQASFFLQLDSRFDDLKKSFEKGCMHLPYWSVCCSFVHIEFCLCVYFLLILVCLC